MNVVGTLLLIVCFFVGLLFILFGRTRAVGIFMAVLSTVSIGIFVCQANNRNAAFDGAESGQTEAEIVAAFGEPPRVTDGTEWVESGVKRSAGELIQNCTKEYWYYSHIYPEALSFCFNSNGNLIHKYRYSSW